jgi:CRP-like cAMP-binding protein
MDAKKLQELRQFLSMGDWFGGLPEALQSLILDRAVVRKFARGQVISLEGCISKGLFALLEGVVHVIRSVGDGEEGLIHVCEPGFWFAEYAMLSGKPTIGTFLAHTQVTVLQLPKVQFDRIVAEEPRYYEAFARLALSRYAILVRMLAEVRDLTVELRLRDRLAVMAEMRTEDQRQGAAISLAVSQADLARMIGASRQTLNALLNKLQKAGLIEVGFRCIRVPDVRRLTDVNVTATRTTPVRRVRAGAAREGLRSSDDRLE